MSIYSGKCDLYDQIEIFGEKHILNSKIYIGNSDKPLEFNNIKEFIPYYPYIITSSCGDKNGSIIRLTDESYVDIHEKELLEFMLNEIMKIYNRCKRKKVKFDVDKTLNELWIIGNKDIYKELIERVKKYGKKATTDDLHLECNEFYRKKLVEELEKNGFNLREYGYGRFIKK